MMITNTYYIAGEIILLTLLPVLVMAKIPGLFSKRHLVMAVGSLYVIVVALKLNFGFSYMWMIYLFSVRTYLETMAITFFTLCSILVLYKINKTEVIKLTKVVNPKGLPWYAPLILYPLLSVPLQEILFRWYIINRIMPLVPYSLVTIVISAVVFAVVHLPFGSKIMAFGTFVLGLWWGYLYVTTGNLWPSIISHMIIGTYILWLGIPRPKPKLVKKVTLDLAVDGG